MEARERTFELPSLTLAAVEWGRAGGRPVIALHGWLDNAGSFSKLAPLLEGCHLIALDAAGHGFSANRSADSAYNIWQDVAEIVEVAEQLGWERFSLLGHSRGAAIASLFAGTFPQRVERLVLLEGGLPIMSDPREAPRNLADAILKSRELRSKAGRIFAERRQAIRERARGFSEVTEEAAAILAERSLRSVEGGWQWHADQRLKAGSEIRLTREIVAEFLERIEAPVQMLLAEQSPFSQRPVFIEMLEHIGDLELHRLSGRHHFHMEGAEPVIAEHVRRFLSGS